MIVQHYNDKILILIFEFEMMSLLILFSALFIIIQKDSRSKSIIFIHSGIIIIGFHLFIAGVLGLLFIGTILIGTIGLFTLTIITPLDEEYRIIAGVVVLALFFYISYLINELLLAIILLGIIIFIISLSNESFRGRLLSFYQKIGVNLKKVKSLKSEIRHPNKIDIKSIEKKRKLRKKKKRRTLFWQARVKILQGIIGDKTQKNRLEGEDQKSWLQDFFSDKTRYGLEIISHNDFRWAYIMKARNQKNARILGEALLTRLSSIYPGLDGEVETIPITKEKIYKYNRFWEIKLPNPPYIGKITLINDIINMFHRNKQKIKIYIMWKRASSKKILKIRERIEQMKFKDKDEKQQYIKMWQDELFKVRIFVSYRIFGESPKEREFELQLVEGRLKSLTMSCKNLKKVAQLKRVSSGTGGNILRGNLFSGQFITPRCVDFNIHEFIPLNKPFVLEKENIEYTPINEKDPNYILIGRQISTGRRTEHKMLIHKKAFAQSALIAGQQGTGKTYLLAQIIKEFYEKCPDIGILILNLGKGNQELFYKTDKVIKFGDDDFRVPYYHKGQYLERSIQETAGYLIASTGLKNIVEKNMVNVMNAFIKKFGDLPKSLYHLFKNLVDYFVKHPYHSKFQTNILRALKNRILALLSNPTLQKALNLTPHYEIPQWFKEWRKGKKIYLDISMCTIYEKRLITSAIFQMIRALTPDIEAGKLQNIIVIDEAHQILEKPITHNFDDDDYISRDQLEKIFNELLREFRSKGLSFILSDQTPSRLFECVMTLPSLKIIFRVGHPCNTVMVSNPNEQEFLKLQKNRQALVLNGISGHKYIIETLDFSLPIIKENEKDVPLYDMKVCPNCNTPVDYNAEVCMFCGKPLPAKLTDSVKNLDINYSKINNSDLE